MNEWLQDAILQAAKRIGIARQDMQSVSGAEAMLLLDNIEGEALRADEIERLQGERDALSLAVRRSIEVLGPCVTLCDGCAAEREIALKALREAIGGGDPRAIGNSG